MESNYPGRIPVLVYNNFVVTFEAVPEDRDPYDYFRRECGWDKKDARDVAVYLFFIAHVMLWRNGEPLAESSLGACSYTTTAEFYTTYRDDYFADMVCECFEQAGFTRTGRFIRTKLSNK